MEFYHSTSYLFAWCHSCHFQEKKIGLFLIRMSYIRQGRKHYLKVDMLVGILVAAESTPYGEGLLLMLC